MMIGRLTLLTVGLVTLCSGSSLIFADNEFSSLMEKSELNLTTENVVIFKDGYFLIVKNYSYFNALIGSSFAALNAGNIDTMIVIIIEQTEIKNIDVGLISDGISLKK